MSGWGIETFQQDTKNTNLGWSTIHLVGVDMIEIAQNEQHKMNRIIWHMQLKQYKIYFMVWTWEISNDDEN